MTTHKDNNFKEIEKVKNQQKRLVKILSKIKIFIIDHMLKNLTIC